MAKNPWTESLYGTHDGPRGNRSQWGAAFDEARQRSTDILGDDCPFSILGVSVTANMAMVNKAFKALILKNHPDKGGDADVCRRIIAAHESIKKRLGAAVKPVVQKADTRKKTMTPAILPPVLVEVPVPEFAGSDPTFDVLG
jgi:hypothetical protein